MYRDTWAAVSIGTEDTRDSFEGILNFRANRRSEVEKISVGDTVTLSTNPDIQKYKDTLGVGWNSLMTDHLGKLGKVTHIHLRNPFGTDVMVRVKRLDPQIDRNSRAFTWFLEDVSLYRSSKWRRQELGGYYGSWRQSFDFGDSLGGKIPWLAMVEL